MKKEFDSVKMMREIREKLSRIYKDAETEEKELAAIRKKYGISA